MGIARKERTVDEKMLEALKKWEDIFQKGKRRKTMGKARKERTVDEKMLEALKKAYEKWVLITYGLATDRGGGNCPLCLFDSELTWAKREKNKKKNKSNKSYIKSCGFCPVYKETKKRACLGTPWEEWMIHQQEEHPEAFKGHTRETEWHEWGKGLKVQCSVCEDLAMNELKFMRSLYESYKEKVIKAKSWKIS